MAAGAGDVVAGLAAMPSLAVVSWAAPKRVFGDFSAVDEVADAKAVVDVTLVLLAPVPAWYPAESGCGAVLGLLEAIPVPMITVPPFWAPDTLEMLPPRGVALEVSAELATTDGVARAMFSELELLVRVVESELAGFEVSGRTD